MVRYLAEDAIRMPDRNLNNSKAFGFSSPGAGTMRWGDGTPMVRLNPGAVSRDANPPLGDLIGR